VGHANAVRLHGVAEEEVVVSDIVCERC
jgi:hypothetical protein